MMTILCIGVVTALALLILLAKKFTGKPKKAQKWEKAEIMKELLSLSEREAGSAAIAPSRSRTPVKTGARKVAPARKPARTSQQVRSSRA